MLSERTASHVRGPDGQHAHARTQPKRRVGHRAPHPTAVKEESLIEGGVASGPLETRRPGLGSGLATTERLTFPRESWRAGFLLPYRPILATLIRQPEASPCVASSGTALRGAGRHRRLLPPVTLLPCCPALPCPAQAALSCQPGPVQPLEALSLEP